MQILIRHAEEGDTAAVHALYTQPDVAANTLQLPIQPLSAWAARLKPGFDERSFSLVAICEGQLAGQLGLQIESRVRRSHVARLGMGVDAAYRRRGIGSALLYEALDLADNWLQVRRIEIEVYTDNHGAIALYRTMGFEPEGIMRGYAFRNGRYVDAMMMARLAPNPD